MENGIEIGQLFERRRWRDGCGSGYYCAKLVIESLQGIRIGEEVVAGYG